VAALQHDAMRYAINIQKLSSCRSRNMAHDYNYISICMIGLFYYRAAAHGTRAKVFGLNYY